jgi:glycerol-1-phosphatase
VRRTLPTATSVRTDLLIARYPAVICDLDGVVYRGATPVPGAVETLNRLAADDIAVVFATNNASRSPHAVAIDVTWRELAEVGYLVEGGATWVATNLDLMLPTARGPAPGNGALVAAVKTATTVRPHVVGKPGAALFDLARCRLGTERAETLVCGDRLDTDIAGANAAGLDSLFVLSGASRLQDLAFAARTARPTYVASDLTGLLQPGLRLHAAPDDPVALTPDAGRAVCDDAGMWRRLEGQLGLRPR